jgi:predicted metallopeptidase
MAQYLEDLPLWRDGEANETMRRLCDKHQVPEDVLRELVKIEREFVGSSRAHGVNARITEALDNME